MWRKIIFRLDQHFAISENRHGFGPLLRPHEEKENEGKG